MVRFNPKWREVYLSLRQKILFLKPNAPLGKTIRELADEYGVNHKVIQRAVGVLVKEGLLIARTKVGLIVHPNRPAPADSGPYILFITRPVYSVDKGAWRRSDAGVFETSLSMGTKEAAEHYGFRFKHVQVQMLDEALSLASEGLVHGAVVSFYYPKPDVHDAIERLQKLGVMVCAVDEHVAGVDSVVFDNRGLGRQAGRLLFTRASHRRVAIFRRYSYAQAEYEREEGIVELLAAENIPHNRVVWLSHDVEQRSDEAVADMHRRLAEYVSGGLKFDAFFVHWADLAANVRDFVDKNYGWHPFPASVGSEEELRARRLAGVAVSPMDMGHQAIRLIVDRIRDRSIEPRLVRLEGKIYIP